MKKRTITNVQVFWGMFYDAERLKRKVESESRICGCKHVGRRWWMLYHVYVDYERIHIKTI